ncbi:hypothetical protein CMV_005282 [Castanea mollissima]|uniref:Uncharacterized protein n=1 Tax=Castanea mollissima TaxID=60419 RepID=A0A8J4RRB2_9ROSI|nr:hypothetical protein CMV_005282 [Castanea mollissima]
MCWPRMKQKDSINDHHLSIQGATWGTAIWQKSKTPLAINGFISLYANFDEDLCLIPKCHPFTLKELVENLEITYSMISPLKLALFMPVKESAKVLIMFNQPVA